MSTVRVTNLQHPSSGSANIELGSDGSVVLPAGFTGGIGTNVVSAHKTDTFTLNTSTFTTVTGLSVTITPTSASSKILLIASVCVAYSESNRDGRASISIFRDTTNLSVPDDGGADRNMGNTNTYYNDRGMTAITPIFIDSPNTTSPVTYHVKAQDNAAAAMYVNRPADITTDAYGVSTFTAIEVAA